MRFFLPIVPLLLVACSGGGDADDSAPTTGDTGGAVDAPLAIVGSYVDAYGTAHEITDTSWTQTYPGYAPYRFAITTYDNEAMSLVASNDQANAYAAGLWSRFDWVEADGHLWICQTGFAEASEEAAANVSRADDAEPSVGGCGGFPWTDLTP